MKEEHLPYLQSIQYQYESRGLKLSIEQAKEICAMEEIKALYPSDHFFSQWEEWDYERSVFKDILTAEQYIIYEKQLGESINRYEQNLVEQDSAFEQNILYSKELLLYHQENIVPLLSIFPTALHLGLLEMEAKIEYLKKEYASFLKQAKKEIIINHFRQNRTFKPLELKYRLLQHHVDHLFPNYNGFKFQMDQPTTAISEFICSKLPEKLYDSPYPDAPESIYKRLENWKKDLNRIRNKYFPETIEGWHTKISIQPTKEEEMQFFHMSLLLMDKNAYGLDD